MYFSAFKLVQFSRIIFITFSLSQINQFRLDLLLTLDANVHNFLKYQFHTLRLIHIIEDNEILHHVSGTFSRVQS
jgi:hypothetical protein